MDQPRRVIGLVMVVALVLATAPGIVSADATDSPANRTIVNVTTGNVSDDPIGQVNGIWHNDTITVNQTDGISDEEFTAYLSRAMARVEAIRELNFHSMVNVTVWTRAEYQEYVDSQSVDPEYGAWNNAVWRAMFVIDSDTTAQSELDVARGESVAGFYDTSRGEIVIITDTPDQPVIDNGTLVHELVHAVQDQHYNLSQPSFYGETQDEQLARQGLIDGDADYVRVQYNDGCGQNWNCTTIAPEATNESAVSSREFNWGIWAVLFQPYSDGPAYIHEIVSDEGWGEVNALYAAPPNTTREIIHREPFEVESLSFNDTSSTRWERYRDHGVNGGDTVGEASIFVMGWYQSVEYDARVMENDAFFEPTHSYSRYNYESPMSDGWSNDIVVPYRNMITNEQGYVWVSRWESEEDAREFASAYRTILQAHYAERIDDTTWWVYGSGFSDAYRIVQENRTVTVVHGPSVSSLEELRPELAPDRSISRPTPNFRTPPIVIENSSGPTTSPGQSGFGVIGALIGVVLVTAMWWLRDPR